MNAPVANAHAWILAHFPLFRLALFLCCFAYWIIGYHWFKPRRRETRAAIMAVWAQISVGTLLDVGIVRQGFWTYRALPFSIGGVPLDLHVNWGLIWGFFLVWLYSKLLRYWRGGRFVLLYLAAWTLLTVTFDALMARHLLFLERASSLWWLADILFLFTVQGLTLWVYHTALFAPTESPAAVWSCRIRSVLYVSSLAYVFYGYAPAVILSLTDGWGAHPLLGLDDWRILLIALLPPFALGTWATLAFTDTGLGTPIPLDPPRRLVTTGPYAYVRNPMQISGILLAALLVLYYPTRYMLLYAVDMILVSLVLFHHFEQGELRASFGESYRAYQNHVRNWLPRRTPYRTVNVSADEPSGR